MPEGARGEIRYKEGRPIDLDRIVWESRNATKGASGKPNYRTSLSHIASPEQIRFGRYIDQYHKCMLEGGCMYQFLELFLSPLCAGAHAGLPKKGSVEGNEGWRPNSSPQIFHSSAIREVEGFMRFDHMDDNTVKRIFSSHPSELTIDQIKETCLSLKKTASLYMDHGPGKKFQDSAYEWFRYFCVCTLFTYLTEPEKHRFHAQGISKFFDTLLEKDESKLFDFLRQTIGKSGSQIKKHLRSSLHHYWHEAWDRSFDCQGTALDEKDPNHVADALLRNIVSMSDRLALTVVDNRHLMPVQCYRVFFDLNANDYPTWCDSGSLRSFNLTRANDVYPDECIDDEKWKLNKSVNHASYSSYIDKFKDSFIPLIKDRLGVMLIVPFRFDVGAGAFRQFGFLRAMRRFEVVRPQKDTFEYRLADRHAFGKIIDRDKKVLENLVSSLRMDFLELGTGKFLLETIDSRVQ